MRWSGVVLSLVVTSLVLAGCSRDSGDAPAATELIERQVDGWSVVDFSLSPNGRSLAFLGWPSGPPGSTMTELTRARVGGASERALSRDDREATAVAWFSNSADVLVASDSFEKGAESQLEVVDGSGQRTEVVLSEPLMVNDIAVAPDDRTAILTAYRPEQSVDDMHLWTLNLASGSVSMIDAVAEIGDVQRRARFVDGVGHRFVFEVADGDFSVGSDLWLGLFDLRTQEVRRLTPPDYFSMFPSVLQSKGVIFFSSTRPGGNPVTLRCLSADDTTNEITVVMRDSEALTQVTPDGRQVLVLEGDDRQSYGRTVAVQPLPADLTCGSR